MTPSKLNTLVDSATISGIVTADISDANVTTAKIADSNVTTAKIADANVTTAKIADGAITGAKLNSAVILVPTGAVMPFAMNSAPTGWLAADGGEYSKTGTYAVLFAAIGVTYGETNGSNGVGTTHFRVPDLRGYFVRGVGTNSDGTGAGAFAAKQADAMQGHRHQLLPNHRLHDLSAANYVLGGTPTVRLSNADGSGVGDPSTDTVNGTPRTASETRPRNIAMLYCIKA